MLNCGSGNAATAIVVTPPPSSIWVNSHGTVGVNAELTATLNNGKTPSDVQWVTTDTCVVPSPTANAAVAVVSCSFTCSTTPVTATYNGTRTRSDWNILCNVHHSRLGPTH
jgi:hypothetical protein